MHLRRWSALGAFAALGAFLLAVPTAGFGGEDEMSGAKLKHGAGSGVYIVRMIDQPVVAYEGDVAGLTATKPAKGAKLDPRSSDVTKYVGYLDSKHDAALAKVGAKKIYDYRYAFNGFAAELSGAQADKLAATEGVLSVEKAVEVTMDTATTPAFLGLTDPVNGLWTNEGSEGQAGLPADPRIARQVHPGRKLQRLRLQPEADRRAVLLRVTRLRLGASA